MKFIPHDIGTFLVESRSEPESHHILDANEKTCSCKGFEIHHTCDHLKAFMSQTEPPDMELAPEQPGEVLMKQLAPYDEFKTKLESIRKTAESITVTDISQTSEMKIARTTRLAIKDIRISIEKRHKELKASILVEGRKIDAGKNELLSVLEPLELRLKDQEEFIERETARIQAEKRIARTAEIAPFLQSPPLVDLGVVLDDRWPGMLQDAKDTHAARLAREQKEKEEAEAKAKAEAEERERMRLENERLKAEAAERERLAEIERASVAKEKAEAEAALKAEREEAERLRAEAAAIAVKERLELEAKARAEKEAAEAKARKERQEADKKAKAEREAREKAEAELAEKKAAEEAEKKRIADEAAKAAKAPDKQKILAFAETVWALKIPDFTTEEGKLARQTIEANIKKLAEWLEKKANDL